MSLLPATQAEEINNVTEQIRPERFPKTHETLGYISPLTARLSAFILKVNTRSPLTSVSALKMHL